MLKHFRFEYEVGGRLIFGRFALWLEDGWVAYRPLGRCPGVGHLYKALAKFPELVAAMNATIPERAHPCTVQTRVGMSGCRDYLLREHRDPEWGDYPVRARIHVSMHGLLNESFRMWVGDFAHLIDACVADYMPDDDDDEWLDIRVEEAPIYTPPPQPACRLAKFEIDSSKGYRRILRIFEHSTAAGTEAA
jgi:hypothetical protein